MCCCWSVCWCRTAGMLTRRRLTSHPSHRGRSASAVGPSVAPNGTRLGWFGRTAVESGRDQHRDIPGHPPDVSRQSRRRRVVWMWMRRFGAAVRANSGTGRHDGTVPFQTAAAARCWLNMGFHAFWIPHMRWNGFGSRLEWVFYMVVFEISRTLLSETS